MSVQCNIKSKLSDIECGESQQKFTVNIGKG